MNHYSFHDSGQNWRNGDEAEVSVLLWGIDFKDRPFDGLLPLLWDSGSDNGKVE